MAGLPLPAYNGNSLLSPSSHNATIGGSSHLRSSSHSSWRSRLTSVEDNPEMTIHNGGSSTDFTDTYKITRIEQPKYTWFDHLRGVLCLKKKSDPIVTEEFVKPESHEEDTVNDDSPWVLPVHVLSSRIDSSKHHIPKLASCTIDTGNQQGNVVSREFVEKVLEYSAENFHKLTEDEELGGKGVTGHTLIPDGAIYLTWYHKKSTRVFRNMRFLISPISNYDLIIGARSIKKDNILDVPNLMASGSLGKTLNNSKLEADERKEYSERVRNLDDEIGNTSTAISLAKDKTEKANLKKKKVSLEQENAIAKVDLEIFEARKIKNGDERTARLAELYAQLERLPGYLELSKAPKPAVDLPSSETTHATGSQANGSTEGGRRKTEKPSHAIAAKA